MLAKDIKIGQKFLWDGEPYIRCNLLVPEGLDRYFDYSWFEGNYIFASDMGDAAIVFIKSEEEVEDDC